MKKSKIIIKWDGLSTEDKQYMRAIRKDINAVIDDLYKEYNACNCNTCRIIILNKLEDLVNAEIYKWYDTLIVPEGQMPNIEDDAFDHSLNMIFSLEELITKFNNLRKKLINS